MARTNIYAYDEYGSKSDLAGWFDPDKAELIKEDTRWNGQNAVSVHTNDQFAHQGLYRTSGGRWVLNSYSQWEGSADIYEFVADEQAKTWLLVNGSDDVVEKYFGAVEDERGPGRPEVGKPINVRLGDDLLARVDSAAKEQGKSRADTIRELVERGLG